MINKWPSQSRTKDETFRTIDMTDSRRSNPKDLGWVVQEQLRKVSLSLTNIETQLEVLSQVLWVRDSQELL